MSRTDAPRHVPDMTGMDRPALARALLGWFASAGRDLPWRRTYDPYHVLVSEVMLQQTQMERVVPYFQRWVERFPDLESLSRASEDEVLRLWEGLGYYSRGRALLAAAGVLVREHGGAVPNDRDALLALPGVGPYTAGAVRSVAFNLPEPAVDANVERVLARLTNLELPARDPRAKEFLRETARGLIPEGRARDFNQALMELGALVCLPRTPRCRECPLVFFCVARSLGVAENRPLAGPPKEVVRLQMASGLLLRRGRLYIQKRRPDDVWPGLWEFPGGVLEEGESPEQALAREFREEVELNVRPLAPVVQVRYSYTRYRVTMHAFYCADTEGMAAEPRLNEAVDGRFVTPEELSGYAFPAGHRRVIAFILEDPRLAEYLARS
ncbi:A/G-specific adenine glycosylase [Desulfovibrio sp.]|uniref:A/G-specific adenine glycosylase n=1 Tax=Desulfovibrio sp. TaxID=885 RepID=UPI002A4B7E63|nr:A/G-specific adenine glycosylase [Desulfovibrio sp.]MDY0305722.1 A/G-specific adenine glycosylase [Desulfovibrionaceae bacterium]